MPLNEYTDDKQLLLRLREGDEKAFAQIYELYWEKMVSYAIKLTKSEDEGADIVQNIFVSLWNRRVNLEINGTLGSYLIKSTRNLSLRYIEQNIHRNNFMERLTLHLRNIPSVAPDQELNVKELHWQYNRSIGRLPKKMKEIYVLHATGQLSYREIAERLNVAETTVKKQISNARKILSKAIPKEYTTLLGACISFLLKN